MKTTLEVGSKKLSEYYRRIQGALDSIYAIVAILNLISKLEKFKIKE